MKLIIQIPCFNEANTLPDVFAELPRRIEGIDVIEYQIIDDGSTDETVEIARKLGVHHIVQIRGRNRRWLGRAFRAGLDNALKQGADILVNTDGDNQYPGKRIPDLVKPILSGNFDIVIGDRNPAKFQEFSPLKRFLQHLGNLTMRLLTQEDVRDAVSGFRAFSRHAMVQLNVFTRYTYTVDSLMQAYEKGIDVAWVPIQPNDKTRESRLIKNLASKVRKSGTTIFRMILVYRPFRIIFFLSLFFLLSGLALLGRFAVLFFFFEGHASGHLHSMIAGGVCLIMGVQLSILGIIGDLLSVNRILIEDVISRIKVSQLNNASSAIRNPDLRVINQ